MPGKNALRACRMANLVFVKKWEGRDEALIGGGAEIRAKHCWHVIKQLDARVCTHGEVKRPQYMYIFMGAIIKSCAVGRF